MTAKLQETLVYPQQRWFGAESAALYLKMGQSEFLEHVDNRKLPQPARLRDVLLWDRTDLDDVDFRPGDEKISTPDGTVYIISFSHFVKIGWSLQLPDRIFALQASLPETLVLHASFPGSRILERQFHRRFSHLRLRGEWFRKDGDLAAWIDAGCLNAEGL